MERQSSQMEQRLQKKYTANYKNYLTMVTEDKKFYSHKELLAVLAAISAFQPFKNYTLMGGVLVNHNKFSLSFNNYIKSESLAYYLDFGQFSLNLLRRGLYRFHNRFFTLFKCLCVKVAESIICRLTSGFHRFKVDIFRIHRLWRIFLIAAAQALPVFFGIK